MQTSVKSNSQVFTFCRDPLCGDIRHVYFEIGGYLIYGITRFELTGNA